MSFRTGLPRGVLVDFQGASLFMEDPKTRLFESLPAGLQMGLLKGSPKGGSGESQMDLRWTS